jgi:type IV pilus assembly protein PilM
MSIMQKLFGETQPEVLGVDISSSSVKLLELGRKGAQTEVLRFAIEPLPPNAVVDQQVVEPEVVGQAIQRAVSKSGTKCREAAVAVAGPTVITKTVQMSALLKEDDMEQQIRAEADQYIPYPIDEVSLDFQVLGPAASGGGQVDVLLAACRREQIENRCAALRLGGLNPRIVDIESNALDNAGQLLVGQMPNQGVDQTVAIIDIGATTTSMLFLHDMKPVYARDTAFGGKQLTEEIMRTYGMSYEEAGRAKRNGSLPEGYPTEILEPFMIDMAQQIDRGLQFFFSAAARYTSVDQILLAGGCAQIPDVHLFIQNRLNIPTAVVRPFARVAVSPKASPNVLAREEPSLLLALGLAMRSFDVAGA